MAETGEQVVRHVEDVGMTRDSDRAEDRLQQLGQEWATAELRGDTAFLGRTLTDDFVGIGLRGFMLTEEQWLVRYASGSLRLDSFAYGVCAVQHPRLARKLGETDERLFTAAGWHSPRPSPGSATGRTQYQTTSGRRPPGTTTSRRLRPWSSRSPRSTSGTASTSPPGR